jgi:hypothetical protein
MRCRDPMGGTRWPDGRGLLDQPLRLVAAFDVIAREVKRYQGGDR